MKRLTRRNFMKRSLAAGAALAYSGRTIPAATNTRVRGANEDIRVAVVGVGGQGSNHIGYFHGLPGVRVVAVCDADRNHVDRRVEEFRKKNETLTGYTDVRRLLEDDSIDAVTTATPNHWHALVTVWACQAGKDVYVEKPVSHEIWEGRQMIAAARKYNRIVQTGTQKRSDSGLKEAFEFLQQGNLGKILWSRGFCYKRRKSIGKVDGPQPVPATVDYDLWCGPAPKEPLMRKNLHYDWHWVWPTGNGDLGNQGIHEMDLARWALGQEALAPRVMSIGGRFGYDDDGTTANTQIVFLDYQPAPLIFEVRGLPRKSGDSAMDYYRQTQIGIAVQCEGGYFCGGEGGGWTYDNDGKRIKRFRGDGGGGHHANFIKAVRSRKVGDLNADIEKGHVSSSLCHMGNISYRLGQETPTGQIAEQIRGQKDLADSFERFREHLAVNGVDLEKTPPVLGPWLTLDTQKEQFVGENSEAANQLIKRQYRRPFVIPESV
ncbi:MAG: Gfo/Idh/MocA family oxidoreductase [Sedimentisphaerales bacterium]|nr:Gfo/Idh/MocA family oxidoreductase [Sedimentisphaerales bacterium]